MNILLHLATEILANLWKSRPMQTAVRDLAQSVSTLSKAFKSIQKRMSEDEVHDKLCQILDGDTTTVARLNKAFTTVSSWSSNNGGKNQL